MIAFKQGTGALKRRGTGDQTDEKQLCREGPVGPLEQQVVHEATRYPEDKDSQWYPGVHQEEH